MPSARDGAWVSALVLCFAVALAGVLDRDLWTPDEPRDAAISLEMSRTGRFVVPSLAGRPFVEKPPLYFIVAATSVRTLGPGLGPTGALRGTSVLWGLGTALVTFLLGRRLYGRRTGMVAALILATTFGFVLNSHWIRVDAALLFFVTAAAHGFVEAYFAQRFLFLIWAGLAAAGAFLTKGPVALMFVGAIWIGAFLPWSLGLRRGGRWRELQWLPHLAGLAAASLPVALWIWRFRLAVDRASWELWLWDNQLGRAVGTTPQLGHLRPGQPLYYVQTALLSTLPWTPVLLAWVTAALRMAWNRRRPTAVEWLLICWGPGTLLALSIAVTKRDLYLLPALPAFALLCAGRLEFELPRWCRRWLGAWTVIGLLALAAMTVLPWLPTPASALPLAFSLRHLAVLGMLLAGGLVVAVLRDGPSLTVRVTILTALVYLALFALPLPAIDARKSMRAAVTEFAARIPPSDRARVVGWNLGETVPAIFYYYCDWAIPEARDRGAVDAILDGRDPAHDSLLVAVASEGPDALEQQFGRPFVRLAAGALGANGTRRVVWIAGAGVALRAPAPAPARPP